uniref:Uncharacterized protein n=1 Tax=Arundo donax TaxID=35708 RepID=A0A0A9DK64_ARUDO
MRTKHLLYPPYNVKDPNHILTVVQVDLAKAPLRGGLHTTAEQQWYHLESQLSTPGGSWKSTSSAEWNAQKSDSATWKQRNTRHQEFIVLRLRRARQWYNYDCTRILFTSFSGTFASAPLSRAVPSPDLGTFSSGTIAYLSDGETQTLA